MVKVRLIVSALLVIATNAIAAETAPATANKPDVIALRASAESWLKQSLDFAGQIDSPRDASEIYYAAAVEYIDLGKFDDAKKLVSKLRGLDRDKINAFIAVDSIKGNPDKQIEAAAKLETEEARGYGATYLIDLFLDADDVANAKKALAIETGELQSDINIAAVVRYLVKLDHLQEAAELTSKIKDEKRRRKCTQDNEIRRLIFQKRGEGRKEFIRATATEMGFEGTELDEALRRRGRVLAQSGEVKEAAELVELMEDVDCKVRLLLDIAEWHADKKEFAESLATLRAASGKMPADSLASFNGLSILHARIKTQDAAGVLKDIKEANLESQDLNGVIIEAHISLGLIKDAVALIKKENHREYLARNAGGDLGRRIKMDEANYLVDNLVEPLDRAHASIGIAKGLFRKAEELSEAKTQPAGK